MRFARTFTLLVLVPLLAGCAGGWRGGSVPAEWAGSAASASPATGSHSNAAAAATSNAKATHATADGALFVWTGEGNTVNVAGEFNAWSTSADPLAKQADGSFTLAKKLAAGRYQYKFVVDGSNWKADPNASETADDGYGGKNAVVVVGGGAAAPAPPAAVAAAAPAAAGAGTGAAVAGDAVTFKWSGGGNTVNVAGEFNAWSTSADPMAKQADGSFTLVKKLAAGRYQYKFVVDGSNWKEDPNAMETTDDGYGGKNAVVVVGGGAAAPAPPAAVAAAAAPAAAGAGTGAAVTGDAVTFKWSGGGNTVNVAGEFNAWSTSADPMAKQADGSFTLVKKLAAGRYQYKFVVDGSNWKEDPNAKETTDDGYGGKNAVVVVGGGAAAPAAGAAAAPAAPAVKPLAPGAKPVAPRATAQGVVFTYAGAAQKSVTLCGDFNQWAPAADRMTEQGDGTWTITRKLAPGTYGYKFLIDGTTWKQDEGNPLSQDDGFGGKNSVVTVK